MEVIRQPIRNSKTKEEYIEIFRTFVAAAKKSKIKVNRVNFGIWCQKTYGSNMESAMRKRFGTDGRENGWNVMCEIVGVPFNRVVYSDEELLQWLDKIYTFCGRAHQPGDNAIRAFRNQLSEIEQSQCPFPSTFRKRFNGTGKAWEAYFKAYNITAKPYHGTIRKKGKAEGFYLPYLREYQLEKTPVNEQGVVFLFSRLCEELGFSELFVQEGFPDAKAVYIHPTIKEQRGYGRRVNIEFKFSISDFYKSLTTDFSKNKADRWHDVHYIICWEYGRTSSLMEKYKRLEKCYPRQAEALHPYLFNMEFIILKDYLEKKHHNSFL